jgi:hypothetical protein
MKVKHLLLITLFLWGLSCQSKQDEVPIVPEIPETSEVVEILPEEPEIPVTPPEEPTIPEEPVTGDEVYEKTGLVENMEGLFWSLVECTGYEISIEGKSYKPDTLPDEFLPHIQKERNVRVKVTYRISDKKYACGTGIPGDSYKREMPIINNIKIAKL